jgi:hypothetical protein
MPVNIINGDLATVKSQTTQGMPISSTGEEITSNTPILPNNVATIISSTIQCLPVDSNGNALR